MEYVWIRRESWTHIRLAVRLRKAQTKACESGPVESLTFIYIKKYIRKINFYLNGNLVL